MSISSKIQAMLGRVIYGVPPGYLEAIDATPVDSQFIAESDLPDDPDVLIEAGAIAPWRTDASGEKWFRAIDGDALEDWTPADCPAIPDDPDFDDDFDPFDADPDDDFDFGAQWSDDVDESGYPVDYPRAWRT